MELLLQLLQWMPSHGYVVDLSTRNLILKHPNLRRHQVIAEIMAKQHAIASTWQLAKIILFCGTLVDCAKFFHGSNHHLALVICCNYMLLLLVAWSKLDYKWFIIVIIYIKQACYEQTMDSAPRCTVRAMCIWTKTA